MKLRLVYTRENVDDPVLSEVVLETRIPINILGAKILPTAGEIVVDVPVSGRRLKKVIASFQRAGVSVRKIAAPIEIDFDKCMFCGACISPCPVLAIEFRPNLEIELDEDKCVGCLICIDACPVKAIKAL
ncbi:MAG: 4Fe-4S binding protein [Candidatus Bathyarchaeia archaeon]